MKDLASAIAIAIILEGILPFASPQGWKKAIARMLQLPDNQLRMVGFGVMLFGLLMLSWLRTSS